MFFKIENKRFMSTDQLHTSIMLKAYYIIQRYPLHASETVLDNFIQQQYKTSLKNICIKLLLNLTFYSDDEGNLILLFKNPKYDQIASLITYGNGAIPGSRILRTALSS
jgi:hypothetical protein